MIIYTKLWNLLNERGLKRSELRKILSPPTVAKLGKNEIVNSDVIAKICDFLDCQPGDIMENISKEDITEASKMMNQKIVEVMNMLTQTTGMSKEAILDEFMREAPTFIEQLKNGDTDILGINKLDEMPEDE